MLNWRDGGVKVDGMYSRDVACSIEGLRESFFRDMMSHTSCIVEWACKGPSIVLNGLEKGLGGSDGPEKG